LRAKRFDDQIPPTPSKHNLLAHTFLLLIVYRSAYLLAKFPRHTRKSAFVRIPTKATNICPHFTLFSRRQLLAIAGDVAPIVLVEYKNQG
jgi:hypothetical protein